MNFSENNYYQHLPLLHKNHSCTIEIQNEEIKVNSLLSESLKENIGVLKKENSKENNGVFKLKTLMNNLIKLNLNMNICYKIIEDIQLENDFNLENTYSLVVDQYYSKNFEVSNFDPIVQKQNIFIKMFNKIKIKQESLSQLLSSEEYKNKNMVLQMTLNNDIKINIKEEIRKEENLKLCEICYENHSFEIINHNICKYCWINFLKNMIFSSNILEIKCPDGCGEILTEEKISLILKFEEELYIKYLKFKKIYQLNQDPNGTWCVYENCENFMKCEANSTIIICSKCNREMCFKCKNKWHPNITCEQTLDEELKNYEKRVEIKKCPKCKSRIEKNEGCNHMTCARCKYEFCWLCCRKYSVKHYEWYNLCGCPNMQNRDFQDRCLLYKILAKKLFKFLFFIIAMILFFVIVYPVCMLLSIFILPMYWTKIYLIPRRIKLEKGICYYLMLFFGFIIGLLFSPIILLLEFIPGMCLFVKFVNNS